MDIEQAQNGFSCVVCGNPASFAASSECNWCEGRYHLSQRNDVEATDCGAVWIDEQYLALQFACNNCLAANGIAPPAVAQANEQSNARPAARRRYRRRE